MSVKERIDLAKKGCSDLSKVQVCNLLGVNRSSIYYQSNPPNEDDDIWLMNLIRDIWLGKPFYGYRKITCELQVKHHLSINRKRVLRLMQNMQIQALYPKPKTSIKAKDAQIYPYLLKGLTINHINQAWQVDITYLRLKGQFVYLIALIDVYSRYIVGWHLHDTLDTEGCIKALYNAFKAGKPEIVNSDQGSQFTSNLWCDALKNRLVKISMTGQGRCIDNVFIERLWRTIKYEAIYLNEYDDFEGLKSGLKKFIRFYNTQRYHQALDYLRPSDIYFEKRVLKCA